MVCTVGCHWEAFAEQPRIVTWAPLVASLGRITIMGSAPGFPGG